MKGAIGRESDPILYTRDRGKPMRLTMLLFAVVFLIGVCATAQDNHTRHNEAIAAIRELGGEVKVNREQPGAPVSVVLAGVRSPTECLPYLARINYLHTCDL